MGESAAAVPSDGCDGQNGSDTDKEATHAATTIVDITPPDAKGDLVLDVTFETSLETLRRSRKAALAAARRTSSSAAAAAAAVEASTPKPREKVAYRVSLAKLKQHSRYFANLLSNPQFRESRLIEDTHAKLKAQGLSPSQAEPADLPWIPITDDDEASRAPPGDRQRALQDVLRVIHGLAAQPQLHPQSQPAQQQQRQQPQKGKASGAAPMTASPAPRVTMSYVTTLAITADRFDCIEPVARCVTHEFRFKWPVTANRPLRDEAGRPTDVEQVLRQKVLAAWLLSQPARLHHATREMISRGSSLWSSFHDPEGDGSAAWWNLPDGLEHELQYRRECILNTIASVQRHFLSLYASRTRQCMLGYDSSAACDSFQLGQMLKFLVSKDLLFLVDFSPQSLDAVPDTSTLDVEDLLATLKQCPSYQVDKHHTNCGLRIRIDPVLDYIRAVLSANAVSIAYADWKTDRTAASWATSKTADDEQRPMFDAGGGVKDSGKGTFAFTRAIANDQRLRYEGTLYADRMAKKLFTAESWDWTPEA